MSHPLILLKKTFALQPPQWPSFTGTSTYVGTSPSGKVNVWYDASLGQQALINAQDLVAGADAVVSFDSNVFGTPDGTVNVILFALNGATDSTGGADHNGCDFSTGQNIEVCVAFGASNRVIALFEAELCECQMRGNLCGYSTGEALSRWCASMAPGSGNSLADFGSAPTWQKDGYANWVDKTEATDQDYDSIGCGMAFLSWLLGKKGFTLPQIAQAMVSLGNSGTLASLYSRLTGQGGSPWATFLADVKVLGTLTSDDPFGGLTKPPSPPTPVPPSPPPPVPTPTPVPVPTGVTLAQAQAIAKQFNDAYFAHLEAQEPGFLKIFVKRIQQGSDAAVLSGLASISGWPVG